MNAENYAKTFQALQLSNKYYRAMTIALVVLCIFLAIKLMMSRPVVITVPSTMNEGQSIGSDYASREFFTSWALFVATTVGNINPRNGDFVISQIAPLFHGKIYQDAVDIMSKQITAIALDRISYTFEPMSLIFESDKRDLKIEDEEVVRINEYTTDTVYVTGWQVEQGPVGDPKRQEVTYEMAFEVFNYTPRILVLDNYPGKPRTTKVEENKMKSDLTREKAQRERNE